MALSIAKYTVEIDGLGVQDETQNLAAAKSIADSLKRRYQEQHRPSGWLMPDIHVRNANGETLYTVTA